MHDIKQHVQWIGDANDDLLRQMYQACDLFVLPNCQVGADVEGFGMVLLEAAACGKATIAGVTGGTKEAVVDGKTGFLVDPTDCDRLVATVERMLNDRQLCTRLGLQGRDRVVGDFDWPVVCHQVASILGRP